MSANGADATIVQAIETTAGPHNANININSGANATSGSNGVVFHPAGGATIFVGIGNIYSAANNATVTITKEITGPAPVAPVFQMRVTCAEDTGAVDNAPGHSCSVSQPRSSSVQARRTC